jgi:hypothetical protein
MRDVLTIAFTNQVFHSQGHFLGTSVHFCEVHRRKSLIFNKPHLATWRCCRRKSLFLVARGTADVPRRPSRDIARPSAMLRIASSHRVTFPRHLPQGIRPVIFLPPFSRFSRRGGGEVACVGPVTLGRRLSRPPRRRKPLAAFALSSLPNWIVPQPRCRNNTLVHYIWNTVRINTYRVTT